MIKNPTGWKLDKASIKKISTKEGFFSWMKESMNIISLTQFIEDEIPNGIINGVNGTFTLNTPPLPGTLILYLNGLRLRNTVDYTLSGSVITMTTIPYSGDSLTAEYKY